MARKKPTVGAFKAEALLIDTNPTSYNTRFRLTALQQVADTINERGLPVLLSHDSSKLPVGAWYEARVDEDAVFTKFYVPKEVSEYEDIKTRVESEILDSVSIGFRAGTHDCSICGNDIQNYEDCPHIPGQEYDIKDPSDGTSLGEATCYVMLDDITASEASLVYSGAVPNAKIVESSNKEEFFNTNHLNFTEGTLEVVHAGKFVQDKVETKNKPKETAMTKEQFEALKAKHDELDTKFSTLGTKHDELTEKYNTAREDLLTSKETAIEYKEKAVGFDEAVAAKEAAETTYSTTVTTIQEKVEALAAPFDAEYKAPSDMAALMADMDTYMEKSKALPSGQQSVSDEDLAYQEPDDTFKV